MRIALASITALLCLTTPRSALPADALIAVASNFLETAQQLADEFERQTENDLIITSGSTGKLYAQITQGAPFDVLLAADQERPRRLEETGAAVKGTRFTYARGRLALWSSDDARAIRDSTALEPGRFSTLALANPDLAPYGAAARQALDRLGVWENVAGKIVFGENIAQTFAFVATQNAELGFVALSQVLSQRNRNGGSRWDIPISLYDPISQDAVLLRHGGDNAAAIAFLDYLQSAPAKKAIRAAGYLAD